MEKKPIRIKGVVLDGDIAPDGKTATFGFKLPASEREYFVCSARELAKIANSLGVLAASLEQHQVVNQVNVEDANPARFEASFASKRGYIKLSSIKKSGVRKYLTIPVSEIDNVIAALQQARRAGKPNHDTLLSMHVPHQSQYANERE